MADTPVVCVMCKRPGAGTMLALENAQKDKVYAHEICFLRQQVQQLGAQKEMAERILAGVVASVGGSVRVMRKDFEEAKRLNNDVELRPDASGWMDVQLKGSSRIILAQTVPDLKLVPR